MSDGDEPDTGIVQFGKYADVIRSLADLLAETGLAEVELESDGTRLRLSRVGRNIGVDNPGLSPAATAIASSEAGSGVAGSGVADSSGHVVTSPMVGTVYLSGEPNAPVFVKEGSTVVEGETLLLIEAMKTFNAVTAPKSGRIVRIVVADAQPVEYGDALMVIE